MALHSELTGTSAAYQQFFDGWDFEPPSRIVADISPEQAATIPPGCPNSIGTQVAHMQFWQGLWLERISGAPDRPRWPKNADFPVVGPGDWEEVRSEFVAGLDAAKAVSANTADFSRVVGRFTVEQIVLQIALHNSYHLGQISIYRQLLGTWPPEGSDESW
jgi:uncharacterized damage-inducible protein DinB